MTGIPLPFMSFGGSHTIMVGLLRSGCCRRSMSTPRSATSRGWHESAGDARVQASSSRLPSGRRWRPSDGGRSRPRGAGRCGGAPPCAGVRPSRSRRQGARSTARGRRRRAPGAGLRVSPAATRGSERMREAAVVVYAGEVATSLDARPRRPRCGGGERPAGGGRAGGHGRSGRGLVEAARRRGIEPGRRDRPCSGAIPRSTAASTVAAEAGDAAAGAGGRLPANAPDRGRAASSIPLPGETRCGRGRDLDSRRRHAGADRAGAAHGDADRAPATGIELGPDRAVELRVCWAPASACGRWRGSCSTSCRWQDGSSRAAVAYSGTRASAGGGGVLRARRGRRRLDQPAHAGRRASAPELNARASTIAPACRVNQ